MSSEEIAGIVQDLRTNVFGIDERCQSCLFADLPASWIEMVEALLRLPASADEIIIDKFRVSFKHSDLLRLKPEVWLNDEIINFYMKLCEERERTSSVGRRSIFMNTFFYSMLVDHGKGFNYANVKKWFRGVDVFNCRRIFIPINMEQHWSLVHIHLPTNEIQYLDSMMRNKNGKIIMANINKWLKMESMQNSCGDDSRVFTEVTVPCPQQANLNDCGLFTLSFVDLLFNDLPLDMMSQSLCDGIRNKLAFWIVRGRLVSRPVHFPDKINYLSSTPFRLPIQLKSLSPARRRKKDSLPHHVILRKPRVATNSRLLTYHVALGRSQHISDRFAFPMIPKMNFHKPSRSRVIKSTPMYVYPTNLNCAAVIRSLQDFALSFHSSTPIIKSESSAHASASGRHLVVANSVSTKSGIPSSQPKVNQ